MTVASFWAGTSTEIKITNRLRGSTWSGRRGRGFGRISGGGWEEAFNSHSNIPGGLILDYAGAEGGQFLANGDNTKTFADMHTFSRASTGRHRNSAGVYVSAATDAHRLDHDVSGNGTGIWVEKARTNLCLWSDDWTNAAYNTVTNMTVAKDQTGADGLANSASSLLATSANALVTQSITNASAARVYSVHIKRITGTGNIELTQDGGSTWADVKADINSSTFTQVGIVKATVTNPVVGIRIVTNTDKIAVQYSDSERGLTSSSPKPTTTVAVTRAVETCDVATSDFVYVEATGTYYISYNATAGTGSDSDTHPMIIHITDSSNRIQLYKTNGNKEQFFYRSGGSNVAQIVTGSSSDGDIQMAGAYALNDFVFYKDGTQVNTDTSGTPNFTPATLNIGHDERTNEHLDGHIKAVVYYPVRLPNLDLAIMTA